ncbi:MAG TPA: hypothetical protein VFH56_14195 [Acidimicrobiales bacterium]|nr:hypothetical protein [Acidimicrobiales bacterium]
MSQEHTAEKDAPPCCPGAGTMAHVRGCRNHPEYASGPGSFWTQAEWAEWSNDLANLLPEEYDGDAAQEAIIERAVEDMVTALADVQAVLTEYENAGRLPAPYTNERALYERICSALGREIPEEQPPALGTPQNPVDGATDPCPTPGYGGHHTAVGAGAVSPPYVCHGCGTWFTLPSEKATNG